MQWGNKETETISDSCLWFVNTPKKKCSQGLLLLADQLVNISTLTNIFWLLSRIVNQQTSCDLLIVLLGVLTRSYTFSFSSPPCMYHIFLFSFATPHPSPQQQKVTYTSCKSSCQLNLSGCSVSRHRHRAALNQKDNMGAGERHLRIPSSVTGPLLSDHIPRSKERISRGITSKI